MPVASDRSTISNLRATLSNVSRHADSTPLGSASGARVGIGAKIRKPGEPIDPEPPAIRIFTGMNPDGQDDATDMTMQRRMMRQQTRRGLLSGGLFLLLTTAAATAQGIYPEIPPGFEAEKLAAWLLNPGDDGFAPGTGGATMRYLVETDGTIAAVQIVRASDNAVADVLARRLEAYRMAPARYFGHRVRVDQETSIRFETSATGYDVWIDERKVVLGSDDLLPTAGAPPTTLVSSQPIVEAAIVAKIPVAELLTSLDIPTMPNGNVPRGTVELTLLVEKNGSYGPPIRMKSNHPFLTRPIFDLFNGGKGIAGMADDGRPVRSIVRIQVTVDQTERDGKKVPAVSGESLAAGGTATSPVGGGRRSGFVPNGRKIGYDADELHANIAYPPFAHKNGVEAKVLAKVFVDAEGGVVPTKTMKVVASGSTTAVGDVWQEALPLFTAAATEVIRKTRFRPAYQNEQPIRSQLLVIVDFSCA